jgi:transcriptional regulator
MYSPQYFRFENQNEIVTFLQAHQFGILSIATEKNKPLFAHLPFEFRFDNDSISILGHVSKHNPISNYFNDDFEPAVIIQSDSHHYISSEWYTKPSAPTWNYQAVHLFGEIQVLNELDLKQHLNNMINHFEAKYNHQKLKMSDIPKEMMNAMISEIVGFSIKVSRVEAVNKMSQNRDAQSLANINQSLEQINNSASKGVAQQIKIANHID